MPTAIGVSTGGHRSDHPADRAVPKSRSCRYLSNLISRQPWHKHSSAKKMKTLVRDLLVFGLASLCGCAGGVSTSPHSRLVKLDCVVEQYDPAALVFYGLATLPYDARSRVCLLRVLGPANYRDRRIAVDLHGEKELKDEPWMYLRMVGAHVQVSIRDNALPKDPKEMIPVEAIESAEPVGTTNAGKRAWFPSDVGGPAWQT